MYTNNNEQIHYSILYELEILCLSFTQEKGLYSRHRTLLHYHDFITLAF